MKHLPGNLLTAWSKRCEVREVRAGRAGRWVSGRPRTGGHCDRPIQR